MKHGKALLAKCESDPKKTMSWLEEMDLGEAQKPGSKQAKQSKPQPPQPKLDHPKYVEANKASPLI